MIWFAVKLPVLLRPLGKFYRLVNVAEKGLKGSITLPCEVLNGLPFLAVELRIEDDKVVEIRRRKINREIENAILRSVPTTSVYFRLQGITKKTPQNRQRGGKRFYDSITELSPELLKRFPHMRWAFQRELGLLSLYPYQVLDQLSNDQLSKLGALKDDSIHIWAAIKIEGIPFFCSIVSRATVSPMVSLARETWLEMLRRYSETGQKQFNPAVFQSKLGEMEVVTSQGGVSRWVEEETIFRGLLSQLSIRIVVASACFSISYYDQLVELEGQFLCPGKHIQDLHQRSLGDRCILWERYDQVQGQVNVVLSERATMRDWIGLFRLLIERNIKVTLVGDPASRLRVVEQGSLMDGFSIACDILGVDDDWRWPLFQEDTICWQYLAERTILDGIPENVTVIARPGAPRQALSKLGPTSAILSFDSDSTDELRVAAGKPLTACIQVLGEYGPMGATLNDQVTLGKTVYDLQWPIVLERMDIANAWRFIGTPVKNLYVVIDTETTKRDIASMLKYATESMTILVDTESFDFQSLEY